MHQKGERFDPHAGYMPKVGCKDEALYEHESTDRSSCYPSNTSALAESPSFSILKGKLKLKGISSNLGIKSLIFIFIP